MADHDTADIAYLSNRKAQSDMDWYNQLQQTYGKQNQGTQPQGESQQNQDQNAGPKQDQEAAQEPDGLISKVVSGVGRAIQATQGPAGAQAVAQDFLKQLAQSAWNYKSQAAGNPDPAKDTAAQRAAQEQAAFAMGLGGEAGGVASEGPAAGATGQVWGKQLAQPGETASAVPQAEAVPEGAARPPTGSGEEGGSNTPPGGKPPPPPSGTHNIQQMNEAARANPMSQEEITGLTLKGPSFGDHTVLEQPVSADDMLRLHHTAANQVQSFLKLADDLRSDPYIDIEKGQAQLDEMFQNLAGENGVMAKWRGGIHQMGLGLRALGEPASAESPMLKDVYEAIKDSNGDLDNTIKALSDLKTEAQRAELLKQASAGGLENLGAGISHYYTESKLSFNTVVKKLSSDGVMMAFSVPERYVGGAIGAARRAVGAEGGAYMAEGTDMIRGAIDGFKDAVQLGYNAFKKDTATFPGSVGFGEARQPAISSAGTRFEDTPIGRGIDWMGQALHLPGRMILGVDQWAKSMNFMMQARALSYRAAMDEALATGKEGEDFSRAFEKAYNQKLVKTPTSIVQQATEYAQRQTFAAPMNSGGMVGKWLEATQKQQQTTIGRFIMPFFPTPVNLTRTAMEYGGPLGVLSKAMRDRMMAGGADADLAMARMGMSSLMMGVIGDEVMKGNITGRGPENPEVRKLWLGDEQHQPYSIKIGGKEISNLPEPFSTPIGLLADTVEVAARAEQQDAQSLGGAAAIVMSRMLEHQSYMQNLVSLVAIMSSGSHGQDVEGQLRKLEASILPSNVVDIARTTDPIMRQQRNMVDAIKARIPGLSKTLPPDRNLFGEPYLMPIGSDDAGGIISMFKITTPKKDAVIDELVRLDAGVGINIPKLNQSYGGGMPKLLQAPGAKVGVPLTPEQLDYQAQRRGSYRDEVTGMNLKETLKSMISNPEYQKMADVDKKKVLEEQIAGFSHAAEADTFAHFPELQAKYADVIKQRVNTSMGSASRLGTP